MVTGFVSAPFFLSVKDDGLAVSSAQPGPLPTIGGPGGASLASWVQSAALLWTLLPLTTAVDETSDVPFTFTKVVSPGRLSTSLLTVMSPASETATHDCSPGMF